jgi:hypothetical protein
MFVTRTGVGGKDMPLLQAKGKVIFLRAHDVGTGWGPPQDFQDVEAVVRLSTAPDRAMGFQLRDDSRRVARQAEFDLLRDAFTNNWTATIDYEIQEGKKNGRLIRVWLTKP